MNWYKGNLHCHTTESDGRLPPADVASYYKKLEYDFLGIADHYKLTPPEMYEKPSGILGIPTAEFAGVRCAHVVGAWIESDASAFHLDNEETCPIGDIFTGILKQIKRAKGIPILCHPLWYWTFDYEKIKEVADWKHFELCNAAPDCNSTPIPGFTPGDDLWDSLLSNGRRVFAVASDDAHYYEPPYSPLTGIGGRGFIVIKADSLSRNALRSAFDDGHFYASTGAELEEYSLSENGMRIIVKNFHDHVASFEFIGENGEILQHSIGLKAGYEFTGDETYVRVRIATTSGCHLWTQPVFLDSVKEEMKWINA